MHHAMRDPKVRDYKRERACLRNDAADKLVWLQQLSREHAMAHLVDEEVSYFNCLRLSHHAHHMCRAFSVPPSLEQHLLQGHVSAEIWELEHSAIRPHNEIGRPAVPGQDAACMLEGAWVHTSNSSGHLSALSTIA